MKQKLHQASPLLASIKRTGSFLKAAEELGITQSAISHRIKTLEEATGLRIFERTTRQMTPTQVGEIICKAAMESDALWDQALRAIDRIQNENEIRLSVSSSLALKWVLPILPDAKEAGLPLVLDVDDAVTDFSTSSVDAAIRFGVGPYPGLHSTRICNVAMVPVASPMYLDKGATLADYLTSEATFLSDQRGEEDVTEFGWSHYLPQAGFETVTLTPDFRFNRADLVLQGVINGAGIGLGRTLLIERDIEAGFLRKVGPDVKMKSAYWLVCKPEFAATERYARLLDWLKGNI